MMQKTGMDRHSRFTLLTRPQGSLWEGAVIFAFQNAKMTEGEKMYLSYSLPQSRINFQN